MVRLALHLPLLRHPHVPPSSIGVHSRLREPSVWISGIMAYPVRTFCESLLFNTRGDAKIVSVKRYGDLINNGVLDRFLMFYIVRTDSDGKDFHSHGSQKGFRFLGVQVGGPQTRLAKDTIAANPQALDIRT
jgi:hypothetical protein